MHDHCYRCVLVPSSGWQMHDADSMKHPQPTEQDRNNAAEKNNFLHSAPVPNRSSLSSHIAAVSGFISPVMPIKVSCTGAMPTKPRTLRFSDLTLCARKYQRYTTAGMPIVTTTRAERPVKPLFPHGLPSFSRRHDDLGRFRRWRITAVSGARKVGSAALDSTNLALDLSVSLTVKTRSSAACVSQ